MGTKLKHWQLTAALVLSLGNVTACDDRAASTAAADQTGAPENSLAIPDEIRDLILSDDLYQHGVRNRDALALALAAKIRSSTNVKEEEGVRDPVSASYSTARMIDEALELAGDNPTILDLVDEANAFSAKGREPRPLFLPMELAPGDVRVLNEAFEPKKIAAVYVRSQVDIPFSVVVSDGTGIDVCHHESVRHKALCYWRPDQSATFSIRISNLADQAIGVSLYTN